MKKKERNNLSFFYNKDINKDKIHKNNDNLQVILAKSVNILFSSFIIRKPITANKNVAIKVISKHIELIKEVNKPIINAIITLSLPSSTNLLLNVTINSFNLTFKL